MGVGEWTWAAKVRDCSIVAEDLETEASLGDVKRMYQESFLYLAGKFEHR